MERTKFRISVGSFAKVVLEVLTIAMTRSGNFQLLTSYDNHFLTVQQFARDDGGKTAEKMAFRIDDNGTGKHCEQIEAFASLTLRNLDVEERIFPEKRQLAMRLTAGTPPTSMASDRKLHVDSQCDGRHC